MKKCIVAFIALFCFAPFCTAKVNYQLFAKDITKTYMREWIATFAHEAGHSIAAEILTGHPANISLGTSPGDTKLFTIKMGDIKFTSPFPTGGKTKFWSENNRWHKIITNLAGPLSEAAARYLINTYEYTVHNNMTINDALREAALDLSIYFHLIANLLPTPNNDGFHILKEFVPSIEKYGTMLEISHIAMKLKAYYALPAKLQSLSMQNNWYNKELINIGNANILKIGHTASILLKNQVLGKNTNVSYRALIEIMLAIDWLRNYLSPARIRYIQ